ncbi:hypothetical protein [Spirosoma validum]|uniref:Uncharacterized protein n=1 Tax=Spirosoma validum TaxID=2771355 RepID=A0A927GEF0_9BACT|nr:hypothetical protein [Spirosoma validum]MBD2754719.1 hypothetical protein [Spirosoma validum]
MKTLSIIGIILLGLSGQAFSMGHPHNMFAARKQMRAKASTAVVKTKSSACLTIQQTVQLTKTAFNDRLVSALSQIRPAASY